MDMEARGEDETSEPVFTSWKTPHPPDPAHPLLVYIFPIPEYILGVDVLQDLDLITSMSEFHL